MATKLVEPVQIELDAETQIEMLHFIQTHEDGIGFVDFATQIRNESETDYESQEPFSSGANQKTHDNEYFKEYVESRREKRLETREMEIEDGTYPQ